MWCPNQARFWLEWEHARFLIYCGSPGLSVRGPRRQFESGLLVPEECVPEPAKRVFQTTFKHTVLPRPELVAEAGCWPGGGCSVNRIVTFLRYSFVAFLPARMRVSFCWPTRPGRAR